jgi:histidine triad (HIT) family protein|tara:strand:+ start:275 stop:670 length:396 start_codon:yes stop_codon:yes gene_type:complete
MQDSIFTKIINKELPCYKIAENNNFIAFLDIVPLKKGHTLVVPKIQVDYIYDLPDKVLSDLFIFSKKIAKKIESVIDCKRIGVAVIGLEVPHAHVHLVPINEISDMNFQNQRIELNKEDFQNIRDKIIESS